MDIALWAYQITPGSDHALYFAQHEDDCRRVAFKQRTELKEGDPVEYADLEAMVLYRFVFRSITARELVAVLNGQASLIETRAVERTIVGMIA